ncbi:MAG: AAA family ATPase [Lachnospiraceae bacterium]|nr:AAA family ATPase [Lachnospiraceae bacterium]
MRIIIGVSNFGKIRSAEIDISNFTIFVGNNNSGKSYMMQLLYGVLQEVPKVEIPWGDFSFEIENKVIFDGCWFDVYEQRINEYLQINKDAIINRIFHKMIPIDRLYIRFIDVLEEMVVSVDESVEIPKLRVENGDDLVIEPSKRSYWIQKRMRESKENLNRVRLIVHGGLSKERERSIVGKNICKLIFDMGSGSGNLYLPPSRTGILLLYKYFFAERDKRIVQQFEKNSDGEKTENELGLTTPVYDFLQFLLLYTQSERQLQKNSELIRFIENHLIDGKILQQGDDTVYRPRENEIQVPLYLSSSMVNEMAPLVKALTGTGDYSCFFYDEVETCLHPAKQGEMARLLMRLNNSGKKLVISTHSDTMASKMNNLLLLSFSEESSSEKEAKLKKLGLTQEDLLQSEHVHVYQFVNQDNGSSIVKELEFKRVPYTGYDFSQFMDSAQNLYEESMTVME